MTKVYAIKDLFGIQITECKCDKSCDLGEYLDYDNSRKRLVDKLVQECTENIAEITLFVHKNLSESS